MKKDRHGETEKKQNRLIGDTETRGELQKTETEKRPIITSNDHKRSGEDTQR